MKGLTRGETLCKDGGFNKSRLNECRRKKPKGSSLLAARVLGHSLGALADCVLRQFTR